MACEHVSTLTGSPTHLEVGSARIGAIYGVAGKEIGIQQLVDGRERFQKHRVGNNSNNL
eukprot:CAMPEP_0175901298 /NCGR_PEP_ID=MMETSP0108-20121206/2792_1 /TAXON_ID=195067 ORGANISM="Goniomonas pacifica, Strain CCMP1869" /NCGR_SAMPLE_ID=MMETSP0108 /ASSEMBLY_ACC=CAM_ASM_000204 /LENGTH=58 /DNA_ID=CAMNT_0017222881 /DNA_START=310 /DNA_END=486 /DNA_ORIENTATION=+